MASTLNIPLTVLTVGTHDFGPAIIADSDVQALLNIQRDVSKGNVQGFNGSPVSTTCQISVFQSNDGGNTWDMLAWAGFSGGSLINPRTGLPVTVSGVGVPFWPGVNRQARAEVVIGGSASVAVQGTLAVS